MQFIRGFLFMLLVGFLSGAAVTSFIAPSIVTWYNAPGQGGALCVCTEVARGTTHLLLQAQIVGGGVGLGLVLSFYTFYSFFRRKRGASGVPPGPPTTIP